MENGNGEDKMTTRYKTLVVGDAGIGKTAFVMRYRNDTFVEAYVPTVGIDFIKKTLTRYFIVCFKCSINNLNLMLIIIFSL